MLIKQNYLTWLVIILTIFDNIPFPMPFHGCAKRKCGFFPQHHGNRVNCHCCFVLVGLKKENNINNTTHTHTCLTALCPGLPRWAGTRKVQSIWILLKQETLSGSGISWAICKSVPCSRQITTPAPHHSVFYRPDAFPDAQPTASKHWRHKY